MPRGPLSAEAKAKISRAAKRRWARLKVATLPAPPVTTNGIQVESRIVLRLREQEFELTTHEVVALKLALDQLTGTTAPRESA